MKRAGFIFGAANQAVPQTYPGLRVLFSRTFTDSNADVPMRKCLLVSKVTRYEFEQNRHRGATINQLEQVIRRRGSDYETLLHYHRLQKDFEKNVLNALREFDADVKLVNRLSYSPSLINWCDVVIPCGGDGTFLLAASKVKDNRKPVIGFNSDPSRSEGRLCLPKWCSRDIKGAIIAIKEGRFSWLHRSRIKTTLASNEKVQVADQGPPVDLHKPILPRYNVSEFDDQDGNPDIVTNSYGNESESDKERWKAVTPLEPMDRNNQPGIFKRTIPFLALNEVFIGENVSARVSHLQLKMDEASKTTRTKCSGLCVSTGTGSTSWHLSINRLRSQSVMELLQLWSSENPEKMKKSPTEDDARRLADQYNDKLVFEPDDEKLAYSIREQISAEVWPSPKGLASRGFAKTVHVKSRCVDAGLVIDGSVSFPFNDGTEATLEINPENSLKTVALHDNE